MKKEKIKNLQLNTGDVNKENERFKVQFEHMEKQIVQFKKERDLAQQ